MSNIFAIWILQKVKQFAFGAIKMEFPKFGLQEENKELCCLEATVVTGFESLAKEECHEMFQAHALHSRGNIRFDLPISMAPQVLKMRSVDNIYVVVYHVPCVKLTSNKEESLNIISSTLESRQRSWSKAFEVWRRVCGSIPEDMPIEQNQELKFRVTCYRTGTGHSFGSPDATRHFGGVVQDMFGWKPDMTHFDMEVVLNVVNEELYVSVALTRKSLHRRNISNFGYTTLRSTIAHNMLRMARICDGDLVCDPMCGSGAIPVEGALCWTRAYYLCGDIHPKAAPKTQMNVEQINEQLRTSGKPAVNLSVFHWDVTCLPLKRNSIDVFITDLPFGKRSGSKADNRILYPQILQEMAITCRPQTGRAVLLTHDRRTMIQTLQKLSTLWKVSRTLTANIGGLAAGVYLLHRTNKQI